MSSLPPVKWAQRKDSLYVTILLPDVTGAEVSLTEDSIQFRYIRSLICREVLTRFQWEEWFQGLCHHHEAV